MKTDDGISFEVTPERSELRVHYRQNFIKNAKNCQFEKFK